MDIEQPTRRGLLTGLGALFIAAPAIVRASSIMPVHAIDDFDGWLKMHQDIHADLMRELADTTRRAFMPRLFAQVYETNPLLDHLGRD